MEKRKKGKTDPAVGQKRRKILPWAASLLAVAALAAGVSAAAILPGRKRSLSVFEEKAALLRAEALAEGTRLELGVDPAGTAGYVVFLSVCDNTQRADVYHQRGSTVEEAWDGAVKEAGKQIMRSGLEPVWVKADLVYLSEEISAKELSGALKASCQEFFRYGVAFDLDYGTALLEAELNGAKIYDYENGGVDLDALDRYLKEAGERTLEALPGSYTLFQCMGWLCDGDDGVYALSASGLDYGRRRPEIIDGDYVEGLILKASAFLERQIKEDGTFIYGLYPRFDNEIENYNIVRHASTIWSLLCRYRIAPSQELAEHIDQTVGYLLSQIVYKDEDTAYLYEEKDDEIKLGGCGVAVVALTEYMDLFQTDVHREVCRKLGNGILTMLDQESGVYQHVLNGDFSLKEEMRTVYYDGEATFALCRLYGLTGEQKWLDAAESAVEHFIRADYTQYKDHWVAYSMAEITRYVTDRPDYYVFALDNVQRNQAEIYARDTTYHTYLELLMATFELYDRLVQSGADVKGFDQEAFLKTIYARADRMLNGYFYPEYAMYMADPQRIVDTFMVRHDGFRVRIDDVQHNIGGYYLYYKNYDKLVEYGMLECRD